MPSRVMLVVVLLEVVIAVSAFTDWSYRKPNGERYNWKEKYPECGGHRQSPIDLDDFTVKPDGPSFNWTGGYMLYGQPLKLSNDGNTVVLTSEGKVPPTLTFDNGKVFQLDNVHFYWGNGNGEGSEHTLKGQRFALEIQAVHNRVDGNGNIMTPAETVIIVSLLKFISNTYARNGLDAIMDDPEDIEEAGQSVEVEGFDLLIDLIYIFDNSFYWYEGSLTTPPCSEVATFIVSKRIQNVDEAQLKYFRELKGKDNKPMGENFRSLQKRNGRKIYYKPGVF